ncbi:ribonuclease toxin immunity protein CdiI [Pseudoduganella sp. R-34]|uniref:ribonuclease toxin immunity protein CdiI n=1 Tax=Pseudoduganella sp. R-34 TaxID=3404062 RepID=UPI003CFA2738
MELFNVTNAKSDDLWIVKEFFNSICRHGRFIRVIAQLVNHESSVINEEYCLFSEPAGGDPELDFIGVKFGNPSGEIVISEESLNNFIDEACKEYLAHYPNEAANIGEILLSRRI